MFEKPQKTILDSFVFNCFNVSMYQMFYNENVQSCLQQIIGFTLKSKPNLIQLVHLV